MPCVCVFLFRDGEACFASRERKRCTSERLEKSCAVNGPRDVPDILRSVQNSRCASNTKTSGAHVPYSIPPTVRIPGREILRGICAPSGSEGEADYGRLYRKMEVYSRRNPPGKSCCDVVQNCMSSTLEM